MEVNPELREAREGVRSPDSRIYQFPSDQGSKTVDFA